MPLFVPVLLFLPLCTGVLGSDKLVVLSCDRPLFQTQLQLCLHHFNVSLEATPYRTTCVWPAVKGSYNVLKRCVDDCAWSSCRTGVGDLIDRFFLQVHRTYFSECGRIRDPPVSMLILMVAPLVVSTLLLPLLCMHLTTKEP